MKKRRIKRPERRDEFGRLLRADGQVDRRRPPQARQFQPGKSGNPRGRPKGRKNTDTLVRSIMDKKISMRISGRDRKVSVREAMLTRAAEEALKGNLKAAAFLLHLYDANSSTDQVADGSIEQDKVIIDAFLAQMGKQTKGRRK